MDISNSIDNIVEKSKESIKINEGDYLGDDGLWYCGKCHTKKQVRVEIFDKVRTPFCVCKCESEKREKEKEEKERTAFEESVKNYGKQGFRKVICKTGLFQMTICQTKDLQKQCKDTLIISLN